MQTEAYTLVWRRQAAASLRSQCSSWQKLEFRDREQKRRESSESKPEEQDEDRKDLYHDFRITLQKTV